MAQASAEFHICAVSLRPENADVGFALPICMPICIATLRRNDYYYLINIWNEGWKTAIAVTFVFFVLRRLRLSNGEMMGVQLAHVPLELVPGIAALDFDDASLYDVFAHKFGLLPARAHEIHYAVLIEGEDATMLGVAQGTAGLAGERATFLASGRPLEYVSSLMRADRYQIVLDLTAKRSATSGRLSAQIGGCKLIADSFKTRRYL